jgi:glutamine synthetase
VGTEQDNEDTPEQQVLTEVRAWEGDYVKVAVTDADGILRGKYMAKDKFLSAADGGFGMCNVVLGWDMADECYDDATYTGWHTGYPDARVRIDLGTHRRIPWEGGRPFFLGEFEQPDGEPLPICPRQLLRRVIGRATELGFEPVFGLEFEWFNFAETPDTAAAKGHRDLDPISPGMFGYSVIRHSHNAEFFDALMGQLRDYRIPLEGLHTGFWKLRSCIRTPSRPPTARCCSRPRPRRSAHGSASCPPSWPGSQPTSPDAPATTTRACWRPPRASPCSTIPTTGPR